MSWVDATRLPRRADIVRALGWGNLGLTAIACVIEPEMLPLLITWGAGVMALSHSLAHAIDKRAERVVTR